MTLHSAEIKQLRKQARTLTAIARQLRQKANDLAKEQKAIEKAEAARTNFFNKRAHVDQDTVLTPEPASNLFEDE